ncbi:Lysine-arginine-ornithine-binding periplasmic protein precursor [Vibrio aerogenes CECT 7868]|uniref:Lysine-arginine-ornithine-binding periplasmic protein n=1 Tax=Vibrio aerogenes CECT 7868 TaxID=1216006 RepID=A0A1M5YWP8_9VIBR|nr:ABC transporter substrate-binding protein [Vibrio aerogenes]SHI16482.1 Lysine-arginine-ornithine-binding periplasmic protein precursor [Vibrio aerogenes CECT 7868]
MRKIILLCVLAGLFSAANVWAGNTLRFGIEAEYPPFESKNAQGELVGFDIELGKAVCQAAQMQCSWFEASFDALIPALRAKQFDVINSAMNITQERKERIDFTQPVYRIPTRLIAREGSGLTPDILSLRGKKIGVLQGSIQEVYAKKHWATQGIRVMTYQDQSMVYSDMVLGRIDATLVMAAAGQSGFLSRPEGDGFAFAGEPVEDPAILGSGIGFGVRQGGSALKAVLNQAIAQVKTDGTIQRLGKKYFPGFDISVE